LEEEKKGMNQRKKLWEEIQDVIGPESQWPSEIRSNFWNCNVKHWERIMLATFVFVNGLNPVVFMEWVDQSNMCRDFAARKHLSDLLDRFSKGIYLHTVYAYNVYARQLQHLDGRIKPTKRYKLSYNV
jgi:hypothetical protein